MLSSRVRWTTPVETWEEGNAMTFCNLCCANSAESWNVPLLESPNFVVLPSLGALVEGWVLLVPKQHFLSMGALPDSLIPEMQDLKRSVCAFLQDTYGTASAFEHGPGQKERKVGCGVDHAHLHILPVNFDLSVAVSPTCQQAFTGRRLISLRVAQRLKVAKIISTWNSQSGT